MSLTDARHPFVTWPFVVKSVCASLIFVCVVISILLGGPALEGRLFPVVSHFTITRTVAIGPEETAVYGNFEKYRDCEYLAMSWYRKDDAGLIERVGLSQQPPRGNNPPPDPTRPLGPQRFGPWNVAMPEAEVRSRSYVETAHNCTWLWITRTVFYP